MHDGSGLESHESHNGRFALPVEFDADDHCTPVQITHFDFTQLDTLADEAREALSDGRFGCFVKQFRHALEKDIRLETITQIVGFAGEFQNAYMGWDILRYIFGLAALEGETGVTMAKKWGVSKEAWQQNCERGRKLLRARKLRTMRDDKARANMRLRNYRRG